MKITTWCSVDGNGHEYLFNHHPVRNNGLGKFWRCKESDNPVVIGSLHFIRVPFGTIKLMTGQDMTWESSPIQLEEFENDEGE